jgi:hypothetical protein
VTFCERWRPIPGATRYEVSTLGRIRSNVDPANPLILAQSTNRDGYRKVTLMTDDRPRRRWQPYVHRVMALAFIGPPPGPEYVVDHDPLPRVNALSNLRWAPEDENRWKWHEGRAS